MDTEIDKLITIASVLAGYPKDSLIFVLRGWPLIDVHGQPSIDGESLCWRLHDYALHIYGPDARDQLREWGIESTADFGDIVFALVEHGLIRATSTDVIDDFENVFDFEDHFLEPKLAGGRPHQWNLSTIFIATTLAAILISGFSRGGIEGIGPALISSWFVILGFACIVIAVSTRPLGWMILLWFGMASSSLGLFAFFTLPDW